MGMEGRGASGASIDINVWSNLELIKNRMGDSSDFITRRLSVNWHSFTQTAFLFYIDGMIDKHAVQESLIPSLLNCKPVEWQNEPLSMIDFISSSVIECGEVSRVANLEAGFDEMLSGGALLLCDGWEAGLAISLPGWQDRGVTESKTQSVVRGPQDAFSETLRTNTSLVRRRIKDTNLRVISRVLGQKTKTDIVVMYVRGTADDDNVKHVFHQIDQMELQAVLEGEYLEEMLVGKKQLTLFPTVYNTDRPDTIAGGLLEGKIAILVDGTPFALLVPGLFVDFLQSAEDYYQPYIYSNIMRVLRYFSLCICMLAPSLYIAVTTFHQDILPTQLLLSLAAQREGIPFPAFIEALIMEAAFEILREAGIRMPRTIGQAVSIVGTIVIGQAAVEAGIVSAAMVIIVSITAVSSFVIPSYSMAIGIRLTRFLFMMLAATFGIYGLTIGMIILVIHLCSLQTIGKAYMSPLAPYSQSQQSDAVLRFPFWLFRYKKTK